ncbi:glutaminyl-tRNA synthase (glutamine-hydrolyzing) subunit B [Candidatus Giovannonibacteria bacterium RIFCSPLOWO2_01_FULL_46_13]|uniref:Aspartyl/glutamyl-tRNA(Asn/Gln) amidotransferase subunit B n=1 Tax=Candidatus Giovannonibacteria bacterium RIFCSPLOWO2_01_FULL_46_13 TaxID=1798352 RepID=A0A1F5X504_9BACT|nr:MAG: glutaminyl-tRNA synthase (glutamine-hydrolyzing) subunit B [Candidatus Giovannonibacteria bacterium RIFCSPHIGHO2_12_FULL_44_22]OGF82940.1 MAG: glutaminyl-tRNA synthase (glutamine-hydrolyzing) subunit B [Candidatus Giovannonibacteria bacterium RIFCSPLOWO2_01_FULL_46_13]
MSEYKPTIGLEVHAELKTLTKMFCSCKNDPDERRPNTNVCPVCLAHPGALPVANGDAVRRILKLGTALGAKLADESRFDRKNYFYPDLPKGYQISQYQHPLVEAGVLELPARSGGPSGKKVRITRVHLEEDAARSQHEKGATLVDYNRSGVPLMELVTEPDMNSSSEAKEFAEELQLILKYLGISDADMEKGQMRVEANISISKVDGKLGTKVEVKNINSFKAVERAIEYELKRQEEVLEGGEKVKQETRGWDDTHQKTVSQRSKENAHDYRYFPEPDLPPMKLSEVKEFSPEALRSELPELPNQKRTRFRKEYGIDGDKLEIFVHDKKLSEFFEQAVSEADKWTGETDPKKVIELTANYLTSDLVGILKEVGLSMEEIKVTPENFGELIKMIVNKEVSSRGAKDILKMMVDPVTGAGDDPHEIAQREGFLQTSDAGELENIVKAVMTAYDAAVQDYRGGKEASLQFLIGQAMREAKAQKIGANPDTLKEIFLKNL